MVDWNKEVKLSDLLKRDAAPASDESPAEEGDAGATPVPWYKKEVSLKRAKAPKPEPSEPASGEPSVPWYKKEISLKRDGAPAQDDVRGSEPQGEKVPWYKKEITLRRAPAGEPPPESPPLPLVTPVQPAPAEPLEVEPVPAPTLPPAAEAERWPGETDDVEPEPEIEPEPVAESPAPLLPQLEPELELEVEPGPVARLVPLPTPDPEPEPLAAEAAAEASPGEPARPVSWVDAVLEGRMPEPLPEPQPAAAPEPVAFDPEPAPFPEPEPLALDPEPAVGLPTPPVTPPPPPPEPVALEPEPVAASDPRPVHPPVTAEELPLLDGEEAPAVPWYKRELSFGRKKQNAEPFELDAAPKAPFWKKELSFGRGSKKQAEPGPEPASVPEPAAKAVPFWKKELPFGRRGRKDDAPEPEAPSAEEKPAKPASQPFWKRDLSLNLSLPQRGGGGGKGSMPKQLVGLKIGASQIAAARVANNGHAEVLQVARQPLDQGVIVGGELRDPEALALVLKDFFRRNKLPRRGVRLGIANNRIGVRTFEIGGIDDTKQLANAIRFRAQEALPIPIEEAVLDYHVLGETVNEDGEKVRKILLVVAYRELVDRYVLACRKAGIVLAGIDLEAFALLRALAAPREEDTTNAAVVAVAVGHDRSTFAVSDGRVCEFTRVLEWGGHNLNVAIARALDVTPSEAEPVKRALSLEGGAAHDGLSEQQLQAAREAALGQVNAFARELVSSLQFYQSQPGSLGIGEIIVTGGTAHLDGFAPQLQRLIGVKVRIGDPLVRVKVSKRFQEPEQLGSLSVAIGLGIED